MDRYSCVWDALENTSFDAEKMKTKSDLVISIKKIIKDNKWSQTEAASKCCLTQPRMSDLYTGKIAKFSVDALLDIVTALGHKVKVAVK